MSNNIATEEGFGNQCCYRIRFYETEQNYLQRYWFYLPLIGKYFFNL